MSKVMFFISLSLLGSFAYGQVTKEKCMRQVVEYYANYYDSMSPELRSYGETIVEFLPLVSDFNDETKMDNADFEERMENKMRNIPRPSDCDDLIAYKSLMDVTLSCVNRYSDEDGWTEGIRRLMDGDEKASAVFRSYVVCG